MMSINDQKVTDIELKARDIRISIIESLLSAGSGHTAGSLGMADVFSTLFFSILSHKPENPTWKDRDRVILSNGHICPLLYATMAHAGYFPKEELSTLRKFGSRLQGHPHKEMLPGIETSSGPLGSGLSQALGMALADRMNNSNTAKSFYCFMGDGELNCGQIWEAVMMSGREKISSLIGIIDRNHIQIDGNTEDVMPLSPLEDKFKSFGWNVLVTDGHSIRSIWQAFHAAESCHGKPTIIIANTIPGKGVKEFERDFRWHGVPPGKGPEDKISKEKQASFALKRLRTLDGDIEES